MIEDRKKNNDDDEDENDTDGEVGELTGCPRSNHANNSTHFHS